MGTNKSPVNLSDVKTPPKTKRNKQRTLTTLASTFSRTRVRLNSSDTSKSTLNPEKLLNRLEHSVSSNDDKPEKDVEIEEEVQKSRKTPAPSQTIETENEDVLQATSDSKNDLQDETPHEKDDKTTTTPEKITTPHLIKDGDLEDYETTEMDIKIAEVFDGNYNRNNDGIHLHGDIKDDDEWQKRYRSLVELPLQLYDLPNGSIGKSFIRILSDELDGVRDRKLNMERPLCYIASILQKSENIKGASIIKKRIQNRIDAWNDEKFSALSSSAVKDAEAMMGRKQENLDAKERAKVFSTMLCRRKISAAVRYISMREKGRVLLPGDIDEKSGDEVSEMLRLKHPEGRDVESEKMPIFDDCQECWISWCRKHMWNRWVKK